MSGVVEVRRVFRVLAFVCLVLGSLLPANGALAQGFMVKPMRLESAATAGQTLSIPLEIRNTAGDAGRAIDLRLVGLSQEPNGSWRLVEPDDSTPPDPYSVAAWTTLSQTHVDIAPLQPATVDVQLNVPSDARGVYYAALLAETPAPQDVQGGVAVRIRFLIPLIIEIAGRPVRQNVQLGDVQMSLQDATNVAPATTVANLVVVNEGRTFSRVSGMITVERKLEDKWRPVTRLNVTERSILPGLTLSLGADMERRLPSGAYRLRGELSVDGRRIAPIVKEVDFTGDPTIDSLAYDTALILTPEALTLDVVPGATRTTTVTIDNPGIDPVKVSMSSQTPPSLGGVQMGELMGIDLSAEPWVEIRPAEFTIRPGRKQNVRVISRVPADGKHYPNYYADLVLKGEYENGQSAGTTRTTVHLANAQETSVPDALVEQLDLEEGDGPGKFFVQARLTNTGNVDLKPLARAYVLTAQGTRVRDIALSGDETMLLPLGKRNYSSELDFNGIEPGFYAVRSVFGIGEGKDIVRQMVVQVAVQETKGADGKSVTVPIVTVDPDAVEIKVNGAAADAPPPVELDGGTADATESN